MRFGIDARKESFEEVTVLGVPMLFSAMHVDKSTVPKGLYLYEVRHDDEGRGEPVQLGNWILVNHWGTLISSQPVKLTQVPYRDNAYRDINPKKDWKYEGVETTLRDYMKRHPPKKEKQREHER